MAISYYLNKNHLVKSGGFIGHVEYHSIVNGADFKKYKTDYRVLHPQEQIEDMDILRIFIMESLAEGKIVMLGDYLKIYPSIRGVFEDQAQGFSPDVQSVVINSAVTPRFLKEFQENAKLVKKDRPFRDPEISSFAFGMQGEPVLHKSLPNIIKGTYLNPAGFSLDSLVLTNSDETEETMIGVKDLHLSYIQQPELSFAFKNSSLLPSWLVNETNLKVQLIYRHAEKNKVKQTNFCEAVWWDAV